MQRTDPKSPSEVAVAALLIYRRLVQPLKMARALAQASSWDPMLLVHQLLPEFRGSPVE